MRITKLRPGQALSSQVLSIYVRVSLCCSTRSRMNQDDKDIPYIEILMILASHLPANTMRMLESIAFSGCCTASTASTVANQLWKVLALTTTRSRQDMKTCLSSNHHLTHSFPPLLDQTSFHSFHASFVLCYNLTQWLTRAKQIPFRPALPL